MARIIFAFEGLGNFNDAHLNTVTGISILNFLRLAGVNVTADRIIAVGQPNSTNLNQSRDFIFYFDWSGLAHAIDLFSLLGLANPIAPGQSLYNTLVITGHSLGGGAAWDFSHAIRKRVDTVVNLGFTIDPRNSNFILTGNENDFAPWKHNGQTFPAAAGWINYHQNTSGWTGYALPGLAPGDDRLVTPQDFPGVSHDALLSYTTSHAAAGLAQEPAVTAMWRALQAVPFSQPALLQL